MTTNPKEKNLLVCYSDTVYLCHNKDYCHGKK